MNPALDKQAPLTGIRVIDFGHYIAGPLTGMLLSDQGAEVIKIDRPGKPDYDTPVNGVFNRGKQRITLDLKNQDDLETAVNLIQSADVVIENFRPGVMDRLRLGAEAMTASNPGLVYLSLPGFASTDEKASVRAFEGIISAAIGQYTDLQATRRIFDAAPPIYTPMPLGSTYGAIHGAIAVTLALYAREESGQGEIIESSLVGAAMSAMAVILLDVADKPNRYGGNPSESRRKAIEEANEKIREGGESAVAEVLSQSGGSGGPAFSGTFRAGDGKWLYIISAGHTRNSRSLAKTLEVYDDLIADGMVDVPLYENLELTNNIPDSSHISREWNQKARKRIEAVLASEPAQHWVDVLTAAGVPCAIQRTSQEWLHKPEPEEAALTVVVDDPEYGPTRQLGVQTRLAKTPDEDVIPKPSEPFTRSVEPKTTNGTPAASAKPILEGIRVLDLSNVLAGPASARTLAEYGAEVIKIDPPVPYFGPRVSSWFPMEVSPGKRSIILNLKEEAGKEAFMKLVETSDIIVHNFRPGVPQNLGIDYDTLKKIKPDLIYVNLTAFNGPLPGPWMNRPGFDPLLQGATGIQMRYGGKGNRPILHGWASAIDYITGYSASFGAVLALLKRKRSGVTDGGDLVTTSLAQGGQLVQAPFMYACEAGCSGDEPWGQEAVGEHALHRIYQAQDAWVFLGGLESELSKLKSISEFENAPSNNAALQSFLEAEIKKRDVAHWVKTFNNVGLAGHRIDSLEDIRKMYLHKVTGDTLDTWDDGRSISIVRFIDHPVGSTVDMAPPAYVRMKNAPIQLLYACPKQGDNTREILSEIGYDDNQIEAMISNGVAKDQLTEHYLPHKE
ncbi:MAG: CoA transferase [Candidatus Latescibacteria bacterium]|jgi:crotonobetainyl-CoA:carnitine CoA-transferase CaiB-like acyl-CoA transferase|nr:CoA transferase [Candidatus Latescibacterota bacterium]